MNDQPTEPRDAAPSDTPTEPAGRAPSGEPRLFGAIPPGLALGLGLAGLILGIVLIIIGSLVAGVIWVLAALSLLALGAESARRWPAGALPRLLAGSARASARRLGIARVSAGAWSDASRRRLALRRELRKLRKQRHALLSVLGAAAYREDEDEVRAFRRQVAELDGRIEGCERAMADAVERARNRVQRKRAETQPTRPQSA